MIFGEKKSQKKNGDGNGWMGWGVLSCGSGSRVHMVQPPPLSLPLHTLSLSLLFFISQICFLRTIIFIHIVCILPFSEKRDLPPSHTELQIRYQDQPISGLIMVITPPSQISKKGGEAGGVCGGRKRNLISSQ